MIDSRGQTLVEAALTLPLVAIAIWGGTAILQNEWHRARCSIEVFEAVHQRRIGLPASKARVKLIAGDSGVRGQAKCGEIREEVYLPSLETFAAR